LLYGKPVTFHFSYQLFLWADSSVGQLRRWQRVGVALGTTQLPTTTHSDTPLIEKNNSEL